MSQKASVEKQRQENTELQKPNRYNIRIHNDDYTPMDVVTDLIVAVFNVNHEWAELHTYTIHTSGSVVFGPYSLELVEMLLTKAKVFLVDFEVPLLLTYEIIED